MGTSGGGSGALLKLIAESELAVQPLSTTASTAGTDQKRNMFRPSMCFLPLLAPKPMLIKAGVAMLPGAHAAGTGRSDFP